MNTRRWLVAVLVGMAVVTVRSSIADDSKSAAEALKKGKSCFDKQDYDAAIVAFTEAIRFAPRDAPAYYGRASLRKER